jgi:hypothetical protein
VKRWFDLVTARPAVTRAIERVTALVHAAQPEPAPRATSIETS